MKDILWTEKYRPHKIDDCILPKSLKRTFKKMVRQKEIPNLLLAGPHGRGKTTVAMAMLDEIGADYMIINGSLHGNIDTLRTDIMNFASTVSLVSSGRKYVILDEADYLNPNSTQPSLRNFMEEYSKNCGFILTCNFKNKILEPLQSRCSVIDFNISKDEFSDLVVKFYKRMEYILKNENVEYDQKTLAFMVKKYAPDWRRIINECQRYSVNGKIDSGIFSFTFDGDFEKLIKILKEKKYKEMREWVAENGNIDNIEIFRKFYDKAYEYLKPNSVPALVMLIGDYQYKNAFVADKEINLAAFLTEVMANMEWK